MHRLLPWCLLALSLAGGPVAAFVGVEERIGEIEQMSVTAHWRESDARIDRLATELAGATQVQRQRVEFVRLRNRSLAGDQTGALEGFSALLREEMPVALRVRVYVTAINVTANIEDWPRAFTWLNEALVYLQEAPSESAPLLGIASYLHTLAGETGSARELAMSGLRLVEEGDDPHALCRALADVALAEDHAGNHADSESWRRRQMETCARAGDRVFTANAKYGIGKMAAAQGRAAEALRWAREALVEFEASGYTSGGWSTKLVIADALIASNQRLDEAEVLLEGALRHYRQQGAAQAIAETERLLARLVEKRGDPGAALAYLKRAGDAAEAAERDARERRVAYLQVAFDTRLKEQQIALLEAEKELAALQVTATQRRQWMLAAGLVALLLTALLLTGLLRYAFRERRRYRWQSQHDSLTRLYDNQHVRRLGEAAFARARKAGRPFTAIVADIDRFKEVNDRHGHAAGDEALRSLGRWISETVGERGIAGRSGGDEFTILLEADARDAEAMLRQLRDRIEPLSVFGHTVQFTISSGLCEAGAEATDFEQLVHEADQALYRAKYGGRDRVVCAGDTAATSTPVAGLVVVGSGIQFGRHVGERTLSEIREAQVVFVLADAFALAMIQGFRPDAINLGRHYAVGKDRRRTYREIDAAIMQEVLAGKRVCAVFYGHPGVFADVPHVVIRKTREAGIPARMEPGISAECCLYADLGIDPGARGVHSMEATHFMVYDRRPDCSALLLLWQVALAGDLDCSRFHAEPEGLEALVAKLARWYPLDHEVLLYEAARLPIETFRADRLRLRDLPEARYEEYTTLVIPALGELREDPAYPGGDPAGTA